jgi:alpha-amylase/alpha-mannosidase (GH57 family)
MADKYICIHGHFYQPPRENPWLEAVELQDSAAPFHDWNERITAECYAPNARARLLDGEGRIDRLVNNYTRISFNFGPTLLSWMKDRMPEIHEAIVKSDEESRANFSGHGSAIAQVYNHMIMPLANRRDKITQVVWGLRDFRSRFGRPAEGMWLAETGADDETLEALAELGVKFTILSPFQAARARPFGQEGWEDVNGGKIDSSMPYLVQLPSGRSMAVFFYNAGVSQAVAFESLLINGDNYANRIKSAFAENVQRPQLVNVATDGESYGHHFTYGDMALAYALESIAKDANFKLTVYGEHLEKFPPTHEVQIHQGSAWSCPHGVGRWKEDCGCNSGGHGGWNQKWREPLRQALDWLRDEIAPRFEKKAQEFFNDSWQARDDYIGVMLNRGPESLAAFFQKHARRELKAEEKILALQLLELQRHALLMYTSCGWFFDEISGLETTQIIQYAARVIQLAISTLERDFEPEFLEKLAEARSNIPENGDGRLVYEKFVKPAIMTSEMAAAHFAISSLFESYEPTARIYSFTVRQEDRKLFTAGRARLAIGRIRFTSEIVNQSDPFTYVVMHMGDQHINCGVRHAGAIPAYEAMAEEMHHAFDHADLPELIRLIDRQFGEYQFSLKNIFRDEQQKVLRQVLAAVREDVHNTYRLITDRHASLMRFLADIHSPRIKSLEMAEEVVLNSELGRQFENSHFDAERIRGLLAECRATKVNLDGDTLGYAAKGFLDRLIDHFAKAPDNRDLLHQLVIATEVVSTLPFEVNLWKPQNEYFLMSTTALPEAQKKADGGDAEAQEWVRDFRKVGGKLGFRVPQEAK